MTQIYDAQNVLVPVTVVEAGPCPVVQVKTVESDGYNAVQLGFAMKKAKNSSKAELNHAKKAGSLKLRAFWAKSASPSLLRSSRVTSLP